MSPDRGEANARAPRVLCFLHSFEPGGVERTALRLCHALARIGVDIHVAIGRDEGPLRSEASGLDIGVAPRLPFPRRRLELIWMILWLPWVVLRRRPEVVYCAGNSYTAVAFIMKLLLGRRCPTIVAKISNDLDRTDMSRPVRAAYRLWCRAQGRMLDHLIAMSPEMVPEILDRMAVSPDRVTVIPEAVFDRARLRTFIAAARRRRVPGSVGRRFVAIGRLVEQKNFAMLIEAFGRAGAPDDELVILGDGPLRRLLEAQIRAGGLDRRIRMPGHAQDVAAALGRADIFVLSSHYEGVPAVVIEALAAGLPIVATDCCASMRALVSGALGRVVPNGDVDALADAIAAASRPGRTNVAAVRRAAGQSATRAAHVCRALFETAAAQHRAARMRPESRIMPASRAPARLTMIPYQEVK